VEAEFSSSHTHHILHGVLHYLIANKYVETPCDNIRTLVDQVKHNGSLFRRITDIALELQGNIIMEGNKEPLELCPHVGTTGFEFHIQQASPFVISPDPLVPGVFQSSDNHPSPCKLCTSSKMAVSQNTM
jgi:hypothetical protein